jgi:rhodanese-related sulfurtransferase
MANATSSTILPFVTASERPYSHLKTTEDVLNFLQTNAQSHEAFAGVVTPQQAWGLLNTGLVQLIDTRTHEERVFVGRVPNTLHIAWATGTALNRNPRFVKELENKASKDRIILLICRSGKRSALAAEAATKAGFKHVYNVQQGFEGDLDEAKQRGHIGGWRLAGLPWEQD